MSRKLILLLFILKQCWCAKLNPCDKAPYDRLCKLQEDYDKTKVPGNPLTLTPYVDLYQVEKVNEVECTITVLLYLFATWEDEKLSYKPKNM